MDILETPQKINELLAIVKTNIEFNNKLHFFDIDIAVEDVVCDMINIVHGHSLINLNKDKQNFKAIDLGDETNKISVQVTAEKNKIKETITAFIEDSLYSKYSTLIYFVTTGKQQTYSVVYDTQGHFSFDNDKHIWDFKTIVEKTNTIHSTKQTELLSMLETTIKPRLKNDFSGDFYPGEIKSIIETFAARINDIQPESGLPYLRKPIEEKNELNYLSQAYFSYIQNNSTQYFSQIAQFLKDPINNESLIKYESIASDLQKKLTLKRSEFDKFDKVFEYLEEQIIQDGINRKWMRVFLHYMYYQCDIGTNA